MKNKTILCLALVLSGALASCSTHSNNGGAKSGWKETQVVLYRATGETVRLDAKEFHFNERYGNYELAHKYIAFVDPKTQKAWVGEKLGIEPYFLLEDESGIVYGMVHFDAIALGSPRGDESEFNGASAGGSVIWHHSYIPSVKPGEGVESVIMEFNRDFDTNKKRTDFFLKDYKTTPFPVSKQGKNGLNPWLFLAKGTNAVTGIEAISVGEGKLRLDLKGPDGPHPTGTPGIHTASVWINLNTWKVVKTIQDSQP